MNRSCGILMPIFSLASRYGIGCLSKEAYDFVDFLAESGQSYWQILPVGPTGFGDSPYQPFSAFAGNPYFICLETLIEEELLTREECDSRDFGADQERVDYGALYEHRFAVLRLAHGRFTEKAEKQPEDKDAVAFAAFRKREAWWLDDYALFSAIKEEQGGRAWIDWEDDKLRLHDETALKKAAKRLEEELDFIAFCQYEFDKQWHALHAYAKKKNVRIIGDLPFYVAMDSADAWAHREAFAMEKDGSPALVAGCPPDAFSATGQLWGNPVYDWKELKKNGYDWWIKRIERNYQWYDVIRIDHFHGFSDYYAIPYGAKTALEGKAQKGPGMDFFRALKARFGTLNMIAEDLGIQTPEKVKLLEDSGLPGMAVLQFGFTSWESVYVNHRHKNHLVVYTGTHDNTTAMAWIQELNDGSRDFVRRYINSENTDYGRFVWDFIREAYRSVADLCIIPLTDYLCKGREARINEPGTAEGNWQWRLTPNFLSIELAQSIHLLSETYSRLPVPPEPEDCEEKQAQTL